MRLIIIISIIFFSSIKAQDAPPKVLEPNHYFNLQRTLYDQKIINQLNKNAFSPQRNPIFIFLDERKESTLSSLPQPQPLESTIFGNYLDNYFTEARYKKNLGIENIKAKLKKITDLAFLESLSWLFLEKMNRYSLNNIRMPYLVNVYAATLLELARKGIDVFALKNEAQQTLFEKSMQEQNVNALEAFLMHDENLYANYTQSECTSLTKKELNAIRGSSNQTIKEILKDIQYYNPIFLKKKYSKQLKIS